jgi:hypothetical protein
MASVMNVGVPLAFAFGSSEDKTLYARHFDAFEAHVGIKLNQFVIESDQGSALNAICSEKGMTHLACLRHLLASLKTKMYSYEAGELVKCRSDYDYNHCKELFEPKWHELAPRGLQELNATLAKIGLAFDGDSIVVIDDARWNMVSIRCHLPQTHWNQLMGILTKRPHVTIHSGQQCNALQQH